MKTAEIVKVLNKIISLEFCPCSLDILVKLLNISGRRVQQLVQEGVFPRPQERGVYDLLACTHAFLAYKDQQISEDGGKTLADERKELVKVQRGLKSLEFERRKGELIEKKQIISELSLLYSSLRVTILTWKKRLPPQAAMKSERELTEILDLETHNLLKDLADGHKEISKKPRI